MKQIKVSSILMLQITLAACSQAARPTASQVDPAAQSSAAPLAGATQLVPTGATRIGPIQFVPHILSIETSESVAVGAGDFNGDGLQDLVLSGEPELTILLGDGSGDFPDVGHAAGGMQPSDFAIGDVNADGNLDIIIANHDTDYVTILVGDGAGAFQPAPNSPLHIRVAPHPHAVRLADLDGDGRLDLAVDHRQAESLLILKGLGDAQFELPGMLVHVGGDPYRGMGVGDVDEDGKPDFVTPNPDEVGVILNRTEVGFSFEQAAPVDTQSPFKVELGEFNGDGHLDLIVASDEGSPYVRIFLGDGAGGFSEHSESPFRLAPGGKNIAVGDFNGDGIDDAAIACWQSPGVMILLGGSGSIQSGTLPGGEHPWGLTAADLNGDGRDDLVIADDGAPIVHIYLSLEVAVE